MNNRTCTILLALAMRTLLFTTAPIEAFSGPSSSFRTAKVHYASSPTPAESDPNNDDIMLSSEVVEDSEPAPTKSNPFIPLLSEGLYRTSIAMNKATSDQVFKSTPSLERLRKQVQQLISVGPSSLGDGAGLGVFAAKNIKAGTIVGLYPAHALGYELVVPIDPDAEMTEDNLQDLSMFLAQNEEDEKYFSDQQQHGNSPYLFSTDQPLFDRPSLLSPLFDQEKNEMVPALHLDVNPNRNEELDGTWTSHYINDGASLLDVQTSLADGIKQYQTQSTQKKNCIHIPFGPSPILATVTTKKVKKGQELFTSYGVVYWLGMETVDTSALEEDNGNDASKELTENIQNQMVESARDLQKAMEEARIGYENEMADLEIAIGGLN